MLGSEMNAGLDAGYIQKMCGAGSLPGPDFMCNDLEDNFKRSLCKFFNVEEHLARH